MLDVILFCEQFNDVLLYTAPVTSGYKIINILSLNGMKVLAHLVSFILGSYIPSCYGNTAVIRECCLLCSLNGFRLIFAKLGQIVCEHNVQITASTMEVPLSLSQICYITTFSFHTWKVVIQLSCNLVEIYSNVTCWPSLITNQTALCTVVPRSLKWLQCLAAILSHVG